MMRNGYLGELGIVLLRKEFHGKDLGKLVVNSERKEKWVNAFECKEYWIWRVETIEYVYGYKLSSLSNRWEADEYSDYYEKDE